MFELIPAIIEASDGEWIFVSHLRSFSRLTHDDIEKAEAVLSEENFLKVGDLRESKSQTKQRLELISCIDYILQEVKRFRELYEKDPDIQYVMEAMFKLEFGPEITELQPALAIECRRMIAFRNYLEKYPLIINHPKMSEDEKGQ